MSDKRTFVLAHLEARAGVVNFARECPDGWRVTFEPPRRSKDQNALLWPLLQCFADQLQWPVNGVMCRLSKEEYKDIFTAALAQERMRLAASLDGVGVVMLGRRTSKMSKAAFSELLELIMATAAARNIQITHS